MFRRILLGVDGSHASQKAVDWAIQTYRELPEAQFTFLYVFRPYVLVAPEASGYLSVAYEQPDTEIPTETASFEAWKQFPDQERVTYQTLKGNPSEMICKVAKEGEYDVIVLGSEGHGVVSSVLIGSVSAKVLHHAPCSVLIVR